MITAKKLLKNYENCESIFLYGSHARKPKKSKDIEIGAIFNSKINKRKLLKELDNKTPKNTHAYPFIKENIKNKKPITSFTQPLFCLSIIKDSKTLAGKEIVETITKPKITQEDLRREIGFQLGQALAALKAYRNNNTQNAKELSTKPALYGSRTLIYANKKEFYTNYKKITQETTKILENNKHKKCVKTPTK
jgi:hypothetical protein